MLHAGEVAGTDRTCREAVDVRVAAGPQAAAIARSAVQCRLAGHVGERVLVDAQLVVSELVTNSVRHAGLVTDEYVHVRADLLDGILRLEVDDPGTTGTVAARAPDLGGGGGFGLRIVDAVSNQWGISRDGGTHVWAELVRWPATG